MANEIEFSFLEPQDLMTKTTYDSNGDNVVEVAQDIEGFSTAQDNTFYGKVGGVTGFYTISSGATALDELSDVDTTTTAPTSGDALVFDGTNFVPQAVSGSGATILNELTDVDTTGVVTNNVIKYDGTNWVDGSVDYSEVSNTPVLSTVATSGSYTDLINQPSIPSSVDDLIDVDTTTTAPTSGDALVFDGTNFVPQAVSGSGATILNELTDVDTTGVVTDNVLKFDGTNWVDGVVSYSEISGTPSLAVVATSGDYNDLSNTPSIPVNVNDLSDVDTTGVVANNVLKYDGANWVDGSVAYSEVTGTPTLATVATTGSYNDLSNLPVLSTVATSGDYNDLVNTPVIPTSINELSDVDTTGITSGQVLQFDGTSFVAATVSGSGATVLDELGDVDTTTTAPTSGDALVYDGTNFVPQAISGGSSTLTYEWVELWYTSGSSGDLSAPDAIQNTTPGVNVNIVNGPGGIVEFTFNGKAYPPISIQQYAHVTQTNEYIINTPVTSTRKVSGGGATYDQTTLFSGTFDNVITLDCAQGQVGASAGLGERARLYLMFTFGE